MNKKNCLYHYGEWYYDGMNFHIPFCNCGRLEKENELKKIHEYKMSQNLIEFKNELKKMDWLGRRKG